MAGYPFSPGDIVIVEAVVNHVGTGPFADEMTIFIEGSEDVLGHNTNPLIALPVSKVRRKITAYKGEQ